MHGTVLEKGAFQIQNSKRLVASAKGRQAPRTHSRNRRKETETHNKFQLLRAAPLTTMQPSKPLRFASAAHEARGATSRPIRFRRPRQHRERGGSTRGP